jgi:hypothetical protein
VKYEIVAQLPAAPCVAVFLDDFVGFISPTTTPPDNETIELIKYFQTQVAPCIFIPRKHCPAKHFFPVDAVFGVHAAGSVVAIGVSEILLSGREKILRRISGAVGVLPTCFNVTAKGRRLEPSIFERLLEFAAIASALSLSMVIHLLKSDSALSDCAYEYFPENLHL